MNVEIIQSKIQEKIKGKIKFAEIFKFLNVLVGGR